MDNLQKIWESAKTEEGCILATSAGDRVTMRTVSPVYHQDAILIFTAPQSLKYQQLKENPNCCLALGGGYIEARAEFLGPTMDDKNGELREVYAAKFQGAFDEGIEFGGRASEFILLKPTLVKGWGFENGMPTGPFEYKL